MGNVPDIGVQVFSAAVSLFQAREEEKARREQEKLIERELEEQERLRVDREEKEKEAVEQERQALADALESELRSGSEGKFRRRRLTGRESILTKQRLGESDLGEDFGRTILGG